MGAFAIDPGPTTVGGVTYETPMMAVTGITSVQYQNGDVIGGLMLIPLPAGVISGVIQRVVIMDPDKQSGSLDLVFFDGRVAAATDNTSATWTDTADHQRILGTISMTGSTYVAWATESTATRNNLGFPFYLRNEGLYMVPVARSGPTYTPTNSLQIKLSFQLARK